MKCDSPVPGLFTLVLHTHLPWLAHHGRWPVGEEWLYQSWSAAYLPLMRVLRRLADEDRHHLVTLGMTPVVTAQLDDPYSLTGMHHWLANWRLRAHEATTLQEPLRQFGIREVSEADRELDEFTTLWRHGGSPLLRELIDARRHRVARWTVVASVPAVAESAAARVRAARGSGRCQPAAGAHADRHLGAGMRVRAGDGIRLRRSRCRAFHGGWPVAARRHGAWPSGRRFRCHRIRSRSTGQLPGVVAEVRLSRSCRLPRLPHLRPRDRPQAGPRHRPQRSLGCQGALRPRARRARGRRARRRFRRCGAPPARHGERADRQARTRDRRVRHRTVRPLVVRGSGVAGAGVACAARRRHPGRHAVRRGHRRVHRRARSNCRPALGVPARTGRCGRARRSPTSYS